MRVAAATVLILAICIPGAQATGNVPASSRAKTKLERIVAGLVAQGAPGALAVVRTPSGVHRAAAGFGQLKPRVRLRAVDRFRAASVTKSFVATLVLELAAEGRLSLEDPVEHWLPGLVPSGAGITLHELLNHTSGLFDYDQDSQWVSARYNDPSRIWLPRELVAIAVKHPPLFPPGSGWSYSNTNYVLLGLIVEAVTGKPLGQVLGERIFKPLSLTATSYPLQTPIPGRFAHGYVSLSGPPLIDISSLLSPSAWGAGQIVSNGGDLTRFFSALLAGRLLAPSQLRLMESAVPGHGYGLGLLVVHTPCGTAYGHDGDAAGWRNIVWATAHGTRVASVMVNVDTTYVPWASLRAAAVSALCRG